MPQLRKKDLILNMNLRDWLIPKNEIFFELLEEHANKVHKASNIFCRAIINERFNKSTVSKVKKLESECDKIVKKIFINLNRTFITPIDHEDIGRLIIASDDLIDLIYTISRKIYVYEINGKNKTLKSFALIIQKMVNETLTLVVKSNKLKQQLLMAHAEKINKLENKADDLLIESLKKVFKRKDIKRLIKEKEVYEMMEVLTDKIEDFCDRIQGVVTKNL